ncbi:MAG: hypothetical protein HY731_01950 [Candidatus Tectomicrobia bacterium]|nr:hypothetical protein [Candidatus Tectomicrobia bacterium]
MERYQTTVDVFTFLNRKIRSIKVINSFIANKLEQEKGKLTVPFPREDVENILSVIQQFVEDYERVSEKYTTETRQSGRVLVPPASEKKDGDTPS